MSVLVLIALLALAFWLQYVLDARNIVRLATERRWSAPRVTWTPGSLLRSRWERSYWLRYVDEHGRPERRLCRVTSWFDGPHGVHVEPTVSERAGRAEHVAIRIESPALRRLLSIAIWAGAGTLIGLAVGIGGCLLLFPGSNIAPAYGVIYVAPVGLAAGALFGALRRC
jgi:hypothetical protein